MKKTGLLVIFLLMGLSSKSQEMKTIQLNSPDLTRGTSTMKALEQRKSTRTFTQKELTLQDLSDLLWAANGFNRPDKRTNATAMNCQEIDVYVCMKDGAYLYDAKESKLLQVSSKDLRPDITSGKNASEVAPVCLVIVADMNRSREDNETFRLMTAYDAGIVSQNVYLFCSASGFGTVCRAGMNKEILMQGLGLTDKQIVHLNMPVGYME